MLFVETLFIRANDHSCVLSSHFYTDLLPIITSYLNILIYLRRSLTFKGNVFHLPDFDSNPQGNYKMCKIFLIINYKL